MTFHLSIQFKKSRSKDFAQVLKNAGEFDHFEKGEVYKLDIYSIEELYLKWDNFNIIHHYVRKWSGTSMCINDAPFRTNDVFYNLQQLKYCYADVYKKAYDKTSHCDSSDWGCHGLKSVLRFMDGIFGPFWYDYGKFTDETTWKIDKHRILNILTEEANQKQLFLCPAFNQYKITSLLLRLPDSITVDGRKWIKKYKTEETINGLVKIAIGIDRTSNEYAVVAEQPEFLNEYPAQSKPEGLSENDLANWYIDQWKNGLIK